MFHSQKILWYILFKLQNLINSWFLSMHFDQKGPKTEFFSSMTSCSDYLRDKMKMNLEWNRSDQWYLRIFQYFWTERLFFHRIRHVVQQDQRDYLKYFLNFFSRDLKSANAIHESLIMSNETWLHGSQTYSIQNCRQHIEQRHLMFRENLPVFYWSLRAC